MLAGAMWTGRYLFLVPVMAMAGQSRQEEDRTRERRDVPNRRSAVRRAADRHDPDRRRAHVLSCSLARADPRALQAHSGTLIWPSHRARPKRQRSSVTDPDLLIPAIGQSFVKLDPRTMARNPVMFIVEIGAVMTTYGFIAGLVGNGTDNSFVGQIALWLWFTVLFANFAEAIAEGRGKAQAQALRRTRTETIARKLDGGIGGKETAVPAIELAQGRHRRLRSRRCHPE